MDKIRIMRRQHRCKPEAFRGDHRAKVCAFHLGQHQFGAARDLEGLDPFAAIEFGLDGLKGMFVGKDRFHHRPQKGREGRVAAEPYQPPIAVS